jgi:hypothetical protein
MSACLDGTEVKSRAPIKNSSKTLVFWHTNKVKSLFFGTGTGSWLIPLEFFENQEILNVFVLLFSHCSVLLMQFS